MKRKINYVLLVDDNDSDNFLHKRVIEKAGITDHIEIAENDKDALDFIVNRGENENHLSVFSKPELIFLDINMPIMDGWEFLQEYEKLDEIKNGKTVIVILTTSVNPVDKTRAEDLLEPGCFQYKPLTLKMINEILQLHFPDYL